MAESPVRSWQTNRLQLSRGENAAEYIPTWQVGREQQHPHPLRKYAAEGYGQNSLVFSCIKEKATSFASLEPIVIRADGTVVRTHRVLKLLKNPNEHQDGHDFAELLKTQYEAAGNVYVHMKTEPRRDFEGYPVTSLELLRPDAVTIEPGANPERDVFIVTVGGQVRARLRRDQVIHIHEPNLVNDFYGASKIAVLAAEVDVDTEMTQFESAFFRNAGVPMGILKVKGRKTVAETDEIKSLWRRSFNGFKSWFNVLVLNMDETEYTPLGLKQSDMEMDSTRFHSESRTCSVFGVPGVIVGARFAMMGGGTTTTYEDAEHAFWAETMVPDTNKIARAFTKHLFPRFATTRDRDAIMAYDFTQVRALQEDRSRKFREVARMVLTGAFTVNQALTLNGLPAIPDGDFYIRNGNQVIALQDGTLIPMAEKSEGPNLDNPLEGAARLQPAAAVEEAISIMRRAE